MKRMVDTYIDVELPYPDAKVASILAVGGPIKYELREGSGLTEQRILENVGNGIATICPDAIAITLGKVLLWGIFDEGISSILDQRLVESVKQDVCQFCSLVDGVNPVKKVGLLITGSDNALVITQLDDEEYDEDGVDENGNVTGGQARRVAQFRGNDNGVGNKARALTSTVNALCRQNEDLKNELVIFKEANSAMMKQMNDSIKRLTMLPISRVITSRGSVGSIGSNSGGHVNEVGTGVGAGDGTNSGIVGGSVNTYHTTLSKCPKSLYVLWQEYEFGIGGRKPAKLFSAMERGKVKYIIV